MRLLRGDGGWVHCELSEARPIYFDDEPAVLQVVRDVTLRRELQGHLAVADKMATLSTLAAGIAHELNNPLTLVQANLELHAATHGHSPELDAALEGARRAGVIVGDLRRFAHPEGDEPEPVELAEVIESSVTLASGRLRPCATVDVRASEVPPVLAHRGRLGQVVLNLLLNAADAFDPARHPRHNRIAVRLTREGDHAVIEVEDNAGGIEPRHLEHVFDPFFSTKPTGAGSGLGLSVARGIATGYGGTLEVDNRPGHGACFRVRLPLTKPGACAAPRATPAAPRILLIDDEPALVSAVRAGLELAGYRVETATSGNRAIARLARDAAFDAVVCDLAMPDGTGIDVYHHLQRRHPELAARTIFISGGAATPTARAFLADVATECVAKPFLLADLERALSRVLE